MHGTSERTTELACSRLYFARRQDRAQVDREDRRVSIADTSFAFQRVPTVSFWRNLKRYLSAYEIINCNSRSESATRAHRLAIPLMFSGITCADIDKRRAHLTRAL